MDLGRLEYTITGLSASTGYKVQVRARNDEGTGGWSASGEGTTDATLQLPPPAPGNLIATSTHDSVTLQWEAPDDPSVNGYQILRKLLGEPNLEVHVANTGSTGVEFLDTGLEPETTYVYRVKAINPAGVGNQSNYVRIKTDAAP